MKKTLHFILLAALMAMPVSAFADNDNPLSFSAPSGKSMAASRPLRGWVDGNMPCPDNTVYAEAFDTSVSGNKGFGRADMSACLSNQGRYIRSKAFMPFDGVASPLTGVVVYGFFMNTANTIDSTSCLGRFKLENYIPQKTTRMGVEFYSNDNGMPGDLLYKEEMDVLAVKTDGHAGSTNIGEDLVPIYSFTMNLSEKLKMENGFLCVYAADTGEKYETAFCLAHDASVQASGILRLFNEAGEYQADYSGTFNYCLLGDASESLAEKGLKLTRVLSPQTTESGKYGKVQVEIKNYGSSDVNDATFQLYEGDNLLAEERIEETIYSGATYKYTFQRRIDCSGEGTHNFRIVNITKNDAFYADKEIDFTTTCSSDVCESMSSYNGAYKYITKVEIGDISQESSWSLYSDFRDQKTDIRPGETLTLTVTKKAANGDYLKLWVDWNGNGLFDDAGEFMGYISKGSVDIAIPDNAQATAGEKTMRLVLANSDVSACETYTYGETEDYTLNVVRPDNSAALAIDRKEIDLGKGYANNSQHTITLKNEGNAELTLDYSVDYQLPMSPNVTPVYRSPQRVEGVAPAVNYAPATAAVTAQKEALNESNPYVLTYAGDYSANTGAQNNTVCYAHYYPSQTLKYIVGMKISSIDVFVAGKPSKSYVTIWKGSGLQNTYGEVALKQEFTPVENSWNHITLDEPYQIALDDLFIGCTFEGCSSVQYLVGVDRGPSVIGFGDLISIENSNYWYSLTDLGYDGNVLIKANVIGNRTMAIDWLNIDKTSDTIAPGGKTTLTATIDGSSLTGVVYDKQVYDGVIKINSNDPLAATTKIPVYLDLSGNTGISVLKGDTESKFNVTRDRRITINTDRHVSYIALFTMDGRQIAMNFNTNAIDASALKNGIYVAKAVLDDETVETATIAIK